MVSTFSQIREGTGELETYPDVFKGVTDDDVVAAQHLQSEVLHYRGLIEKSFIQLGRALINFRDHKAYLALGYDSFRAWLQDSDVDISYGQAAYLTRIVEQLLPRLVSEGVDPLSSVSKMRELLPMLNEGGDVAEAAEAIRDLKIQDAKKVVREMRGLEEIETEPAIFKAYATVKGDWTIIHIMCYDENDTYQVTADNNPIRIKNTHMPRWTERFGRFIEFA